MRKTDAQTDRYVGSLKTLLGNKCCGKMEMQNRMWGLMRLEVAGSRL